MDVIRLFQALMNAIGLTFNATAYAGKSTYTVNEGDVEEWWNEQTTAFRNTYGYLPMPFRMLLMAMGENDFTNMLNNLYDYIKISPLLGYATVNELINGYSTSLNSAQQNSVDYTKDSVTKTAYNVTSDILSSTRIIADAVLKSYSSAKVKIEVNAVKTALQNYLTNVVGFSWKVNWDNFTERMRIFLTNNPANEYRYIFISQVNNTSQEPTAKGILIYLSEYDDMPSFEFKNGNIIAPYKNGKVYPSIYDASVLQSIDATGVKLYYSMFTDSDNFTLYDSIIAIGYDENTYEVNHCVNYAYNCDTSEGFLVGSYYGYSITDSVKIDRTTGSVSDCVISKDVINTDQTLVGISSDSTDEDEDRVFIMNAEGVETLARTDADAYPEVLPSTIAAQIVDVGASIADAVSDIATKNPEYPYVPKTPLANTTGNNLFTLYDVTTSELSELADYLWSTDFIDTFKKFFSNPSDSLISLVAYPVNVKSNGIRNIKIGYTDSGVSSHIITDYIQEFDLGSVFVPKYYNNFLDNNPYTKVSIYLPFIGSCSLDSDIVVGSTIKITYRVELLTGNCVALLTVSNVNGTYPVYQFNGNMGMQFPLSSGSYASIYKNLISTGVSAVAAYASGGALTPLAIASAANTVVGSKSEVSKSGNVYGSAGYCGIMKPYVLVERPVTDIPSSYATYNGVVTNMSLNVGSLHGYCVMENVDVSTVPCTENERAELTNLLLSGFFI